MKKIFLSILTVLFLLTIPLLKTKVNAEVIPVTGQPYAFDIELTFSKTSSGEAHTLGLLEDGRLYVWGWNQYGQLGNGTTNSVNIPIDVTPYLSLGAGEYVIDIAAGAYSSSCITSLGRVLFWGQNTYGQLGDESTTNRLSPVDITANFMLEPEETIASMEHGHYHSSAVTSLNRVFTWGYNSYGQLGNGTITDIHSPVEITANFNLNVGEAILKTSLNIYHSVALSSDGRVFTFGINDRGQLGDNTYNNKTLPTDVTSFFVLNPEEKVIDLLTGWQFTLALTSEKRVFAWGYGGTGSLGDGTWTDKLIPTNITDKFNLVGDEKIESLSAGFGQASAITSENRLFMWGQNNFYQLGDGTNTNRNLPVDITARFILPEGEKYASVSMGGYFSSALTTLNKYLSWGNNNVGQLGDGTNSLRSAPVRLILPRYTVMPNGLPVTEKISFTALGQLHSHFVTENSRVFSTGYNSYGQLGDGTSTLRYLPVEITANFGLNQDETIIYLDCGMNFSFALTSEGRVFSWGYNNFGQLGDGSTSIKYTPNEITSQFGLSVGETIIMIKAGGNFSLALTSSGRIFSWGYNYEGQLGNGTSSASNPNPIPSEITLNFNLSEGETITFIEVGGASSYAMTSNNRIFAWGANYYGQLGTGTTTNSWIPLDITSNITVLPGESITTFKSGTAHVAVLMSSSRIYTFGYNGYGALGDGTTTNRYSPIEITAQFTLNVDEAIIDLYLGSSHNIALTSDGRAFTWGLNNYGQLGDGTTTNSLTPKDITSYLSLLVGENIIHTDIGYYHNSIITDLGRLISWGTNNGGPLGDGTSTQRNTPTVINHYYSASYPIILTYTEFQINHLYDTIKITIIPEYEIIEEVVFVTINGIAYSNIVSSGKRIDVYIDNIYNLNDTIVFNIESLTFSNSVSKTFSGNITCETTLVPDIKPLEAIETIIFKLQLLTILAI